MDIPTVYATIKARLGISLSRDRARTSTPQNPPSSSQTPTPRHNPTPTPMFPLVQYSGDDSEEEGAQPVAPPATKIEVVPTQPDAEGTTAPNAPTPPSGGGSSSPTLLGPTQSIEVVNIDDDSTEDFLRPPSEILQHRGAEWTFIPRAEDELVSETEEEPLHRRTRKREIHTLMEELETRVASMQRVEEEQVERPCTVRRLLDEPGEPENQGAVEDSHQKAEKKRKGKGTVLSSPKRMRPATRGIVISDTYLHAAPQEGDEGNDTEGRELRWARTSRRQQGRPAPPPPRRRRLFQTNCGIDHGP
ncbi:uncharacterized protein LOC121800844 [Salvia splendens]|uniref:uncharacterized protein LOC121800844 n=1 Tax=Salvia splendens TaxID=180675 RepID=UPI001C27B7A5|nr:uncharacterized protein LOC121800844 [Salvia splendens]